MSGLAPELQGYTAAQLRVAATDSATDARMLYQIAAYCPELRPLVAANPSSYEGLVQWLYELGDPSIAQVLQLRSAGDWIGAGNRAAQLVGAFGLSAPTPASVPVNMGVPAAAPIPSYPPADNAYPPNYQPNYQPNYPPSYSPQTNGLVAATPAPQVSAPIAQEKTGGSKAMVIVLLTLALLAIVMVFVVWYFIISPKDKTAVAAPDTPAATSTVQGGESPEASPTASPDKDKDKDKDKVERPVPAGAKEIAVWKSPSGNIGCGEADGVFGCSVAQHNWSNNSDCANEPFTIMFEEKGLKTRCGGSFLEPTAPVLNYGEATTQYGGDYACTSESSGITCWDVHDGSGFTLSRDRFEMDQPPATL